jgi:ribosomal protein S18 acetylase RimI-like enzyme
MTSLAPPFRRATIADARAMAELVNFAGEGLPFYLWTRMAEAGEDPWEIGRRRAERESGSFSYLNAIMLEEEGKAVACLIGYLLPDDPQPVDRASLPAMFVGMQELENLAPGTWYVNVLATYPEHRGKGYGRRLLALAEELAVSAGAKGLSIIVADSNHGARRLYERSGYREVAKRPMVKEGWRSEGANWVLLTKPI